MDYTINKAIPKQPIVFFLGAGSSVPLGMPTTMSFRRVLLSKSNAKEKQIINALYSSAANRYRLTTEDINLEEFLEFLHELRLGLWLLSRSNLSPTISPTLGKISYDSWAEVDLSVNIVRWKTLEVLHEVCGDCSAPNVQKLWEPLFDGLRTFASIFPIFTLNYDWAFERLCIASEDRYKLTDGFSSALGGNWAAQRFSRFKPSQKKTDICLFKLHGSTCWIGEIKSLGSFASNEGKPKYGFESEESSPFEIVYPGFRREVWLGKESWSMPGLDGDIFVRWQKREPYDLLYRYLDECLNNCNVVVAIGYAFGDNDINARFAKAFKTNRRLHMVVVDPGRRWEKKLQNGLREVWHEAPYNWVLRNELDPEAWNNRLHWIPGRFGTKRSEKQLVAKVRSALSP